MPSNAAATTGQWQYRPLQPEQCRWFRHKLPASEAPPFPIILAARSELVRFCDVDNARLERHFRERQSALEATREAQGSGAEGRQRQCQGPCAKGQHGDNASSANATLTSELDAGVAGVSTGLPRSGLTKSWQDFFAAPSDEATGVLVRGGQAEVHLDRRALLPCYWPGRAHAVVRGTWFVADRNADGWLPLREDAAAKLEEAYLAASRQAGGSSYSPAVTNGARSVRVELDAGAYAHLSGRDWQLFLPPSAGVWKAGIPSGGARLRRGYVDGPTMAGDVDATEEALDNYCGRAPVTSLVLLVHGVGQALPFVNNVEDVGRFRETVRRVAQEQLPPVARAAGWTEVLPVQWRKQLQLGVEELAHALRPPGIAAIRELKAATATEVLLYMSPTHRSALLMSVAASLNTVYARFKARHPNFQGSVSLCGHSLGAMLCYDILQQQLRALPRALGHAAGSTWREWDATEGSDNGPCIPSGTSPSDSVSSWTPNVAAPCTAKPPPRDSDGGGGNSDGGGAGLRVWLPGGGGAPAGGEACTSGSAAGGASAVQLAFAVEQLFTMGSPLGLFLALRGAEGGQDEPARLLPTIRRLYNVYHPLDPMAYRVEPLLYGLKWDAPPCIVPHAPAPLVRKGLQGVGSSARQWSQNLIANMFLSKIVGGAQAAERTNAAGARAQRQLPSGAPGLAPSEGSAPARRAATAAAGPGRGGGLMHSLQQLADCPGGSCEAASGRVDFQLAEGASENEYLTALSAHFSYWTNRDTALFLLRAVHGLDLLAPAHSPAAVSATAATAGSGGGPPPLTAWGRYSSGARSKVAGAW